MPENSVQVGLLIASEREGRFADSIAQWVESTWRGHDRLELTVIDLGDYELSSGLDRSTPAARAFTGAIDDTDALVVLTPEYNHSYPGNLKVALDHLRTEVMAKPVGFISYGGISGGLRAVEHLRPVLSELHAVTVRDTVSFPMAWSMINGEKAFDPGVRSVAAMNALASQLLWWSAARREASAIEPYAS